MPAVFRRHLVGKTLRHVSHCYIAEKRFVGKLVTTFSQTETFHSDHRHFRKPTD